MAVIEEVNSNVSKNAEAECTSNDTDNEKPFLETVKDDAKEAGIFDDHDNDRDGQGEESGIGGGRTKISKSEKKARSSLSKCGMKLVPNILSVKLKKNKHTCFLITNPEVYKVDNSDTYVVYGQVKVEDLTAQGRSEAAGKLTQKIAAMAANSGAVGGPDSAKEGTAEEYKIDAVIEEEDDGEEDTTQINESDIDLVMKQTSCTRKKAKQALKKCENDIVEAIMSLTS